MVAVYHPFMRHGGGPAGWLYHLHSGLGAIGSAGICVVYDECYTNVPNDKRGAVAAYKKLLPIYDKIFKSGIPSPFMDGIFLLKDYIIAHRMQLRLQSLLARLYSRGEHVIHLQSTGFMYGLSRIDKEHDWTRILTSHPPIPAYLEIAHYYIDSGRRTPPKWVAFRRKVDITAFNEADYILTPSLSALEAYFFDRDISRAISDKIDTDSIIFVPTGVVRPQVHVSRESVREKYRWDGKIVVGYFGRRCFDKGFDIFQQVAEMVTSEDPSRFVFVSTGKGPYSARAPVFDLGWVDNVYDIINAVDLVVLPNRFSFYDLVAIESIATGTPILTSDRGGNKDIASSVPGGFVCDISPECFSEQILKYGDLSDAKRNKLRMGNISKYEQFFTAESFAERYYHSLDSYGLL